MAVAERRETQQTPVLLYFRRPFLGFLDFLRKKRFHPKGCFLHLMRFFADEAGQGS